ncbi:MAG: cupin domain-containing protein [Shimia sp.]
MPKVDLSAVPVERDHDGMAELFGALGPFESRGIGMTHLGVAVETLPPGSTSSYRHWHERSDELIVVLEGELTLVDDAGQTPMRVGDIATFPAGVANGHHLKNLGTAPARFLVVGSRDPSDRCHYVDLGAVREADGALTLRDGRTLRV